MHKPESSISTFRSRLRSGELLAGTFVKTPGMILAEVLAATDLDLLCFDAEHSPFDRGDLDAAIFASRAADMPSIVRVADDSPGQIANALDCGATGVLVPHVDSLEKARSVARNCRYGEGGRGYSGSPRSAGYGTRSMADILAQNRTETTVIAQIEDPAALRDIDRIAAVEGIDCLFIGTMDLTVALGEDSATAPAVVEAATRVCRAAGAADVPVGVFAPSVSQIPFWKEQGVSLFLLSSDHAFLMQGANSLAESVAAARSAPSESDADHP